jgi:DNA-directed RNA polymerase subunit RPC12/RpoP
MANKLPCPNPTCTHEFSQAELQAAAQLACPKCGFRIQGRAAAPAVKPAPAAPAAKPAVPKPAAAAPAPAKPAPVPVAAKPTPAPAPKPAALAPAKPASTPPLAQPVASPRSAKIVMAAPVATPSQPAAETPPSDNPFALDFLAAKPAAKPVAAPPPPAAEAPPSDNPFALDFAVAKAPKPPAAKPPAAPAATEVVAGAPPAAAPANIEESLPDGAFFNPEGTAAGSLVRRAAKPKKPFNWMRLAIITCAIGFAASIVITAIVSVLWLFLGTEGWGGLSGANADGAIYWYNLKGEKAVKLVLPKDSWEIDKEIYSRFDATAAWKRKDDDLWFAVFVKDYGMQKPRDATVLKIAIDKLEGHFGGDMELSAKPEPDKFNELPAQKLQFKGKAGAAIWLGECWMFFKDGVAYWVFIASPDWQKVTDFEEEMPAKRVFVAVERRGWREQPWPTKTFQSDNGKFAMTAPEGVWDRHDAKNEDQNGLLFLFGKYAAEKDNRKNAQLLVFTFEKKDDLKAAIVFAREYLDKKEDSENKNIKIVLADDMVKGQTEIGSIEDVGNRRGRVIDLKRLFDGEPKRYFLLAVINDPDTAYGILCECTWESRHIWRSDFMDILRTTKVK